MKKKEIKMSVFVYFQLPALHP